MIPARHTWFHVRFFRWYTRIRLKRNFSAIAVHSPIPDVSDKPLLVVGNHFSWWDGFWILWLNDRYLHKKFHVMMLEEQLKKNGILNKTGAFSIRRGSRDAVESLKYARKILEDGTTKSGPTDGSAPNQQPATSNQKPHAPPLRPARLRLSSPPGGAGQCPNPAVAAARRPGYRCQGIGADPSLHVTEIIVYDDQSTDQTASEVKKMIVPIGASLRTPVKLASFS